MFQVDQIGIYQRGTGSFEQYPLEQPNITELSGDYDLTFDEFGNQATGSLYSPDATIRGFFKGPIGFNLNDNGYYGEKFFTIKYKDYSFVRLEFTIYRVGANTPSWWFTQEVHWSVTSGVVQTNPVQYALRPTVLYNNYVDFDWSNPGEPTLEDCKTNNTTNFSYISNGSTASGENLPYFNTRRLQFDYNNELMQFCAAFGDLDLSADNPFPSNFSDTPCYIKGLAIML